MLTVENTLPVYTVADMQKALKLADQGMDKARTTMMQQAMKVDTKSMLIDPNNILNYVGTRAKPNSVGHAILRSMAIRCKPVAAIIKTRLNQMAKFARRPRHQHDKGFKIVLKDSKRKMTSAEQKRAFDIEEMLLNTGSVKNAMRRDKLEAFTRKLIRDSLILDAMAWENVYARNGTWSEMWAMDGATIEMVIDRRYGDDFPVYMPETKLGLGDIGNIAYVQKIQGQVYAEYTEEELAYCLRNPRTDIESSLFGFSELEELIETVTYILNAERYNGSYFNESHLPMGVLSVVGNYDDETMEAFKRNWENLTSGVVGKWKVPVIASSDGSGVNFVPFKQSAKDMEYHQWMSFLTTIACAIYQISPEEINMEGYTPNGKSSLSGSDTEANVNQSQDKGLEPLALFYESKLQSEAVDRIDPNFQVYLQGVSEEDEQRKWGLIEQKINMGYSTVALERKANDEEDITDATGQPATWPYMPANQVLAQFAQNQQQAQQQNQQAEDDHQRGLENMAAQHAMGLASQENQGNIADQNAENQHGRNLEQQALQGAQQSQQQDAQFQNQKDLAEMQHTHQSMLATGQQSHDMQKMGMQHNQNLEAMDKQHGHSMEQQQAGHQQNMEAQDKAHAQTQQVKAGDRTHDLRKMGLQHGLNHKAQEQKHRQDVEKIDRQQAYAFANKEDDRSYAEQNGDGEDDGRSQKVQGKGKKSSLKKSLETAEIGAGSEVSATGIDQNDEIVIVVRLD